jgi:hypothetical protein
MQQVGQRLHLQCDAQNDRHNGHEMALLPGDRVRRPCSEETQRERHHDADDGDGAVSEEDFHALVFSRIFFRHRLLPYLRED